MVTSPNCWGTLLVGGLGLQCQWLDVFWHLSVCGALTAVSLVTRTFDNALHADIRQSVKPYAWMCVASPVTLMDQTDAVWLDGLCPSPPVLVVKQMPYGWMWSYTSPTAYHQVKALWCGQRPRASRTCLLFMLGAGRSDAVG